MAEIGIINEIGDMGLGFDVLNEQDQKIANKKLQEDKEKKSKDNK